MDINIEYVEFEYNCDLCGRPIKKQLQFVQGQPKVDLHNKWWCSNPLCNTVYSMEYKAKSNSNNEAVLSISKFLSGGNKKKTKRLVLPVVTT